MKYFRAMCTGALVWLCVSISFTILESVPQIKDSLNLQSFFVCLLLVPFAIFGASIFYRNGNKEQGLKVGLIMGITALLLDAVITVPFVEMPRGGSYQSFFSYPILWLMVLINVTTVFFFWKLKIKGS